MNDIAEVVGLRHVDPLRCKRRVSHRTFVNSGCGTAKLYRTTWQVPCAGRFWDASDNPKSQHGLLLYGPTQPPVNPAILAPMLADLEEECQSFYLSNFAVDGPYLLGGLDGDVERQRDVPSPWCAPNRIVEIRTSRQMFANGVDHARFKVVVGEANRFDFVDAREKMDRFEQLDRRTMIHGPLQAQWR